MDSLALVADDGVSPLTAAEQAILYINTNGFIEVNGATFTGTGIHAKIKALTPFGEAVYKQIEITEVSGCVA
jgi:hypothetical protein